MYLKKYINEKRLYKWEIIQRKAYNDIDKNKIELLNSPQNLQTSMETYTEIITT